MKPGFALVRGDAPTLARAEAVLGAAEQALLATYTAAKRRQDWLLGRLAAKLAVCEVLGGEPREVTIERESNGHPRVRSAGGVQPGWDLSLTHGHGLGAAVYAPAPVGIDLERLRAVPPGGWRFFLAPQERAWLQAQPLGEHGELVCWALKEAAYKAVQGETLGLPHLLVEAADAGRALIGHVAGPLEARYLIGRRFCLAVATPRATAAWLAEWDLLDWGDVDEPRH